MYACDRILVPTDMSDFASLALRYGAMFRDRIGAALTVMFADEVHVPADLFEVPIGYYLDNAPLSRERLQARLDEYAKGLIGGPYETAIVQDSPSRAIVRMARSTRADLIIMGTHGRTGIRRAVLGSVTENVLRETEVPVLTVTPNRMQSRTEPAIRRILCPVNFTHIARVALEHACNAAEAFDAELNVIYVVEGIDAAQADRVEIAFEQWVDPQVRDRCRFSRLVVQDGNPAERVLAAARSSSADLIVVGAQHRFFSDATVIGTTTERVTRFAGCPVLTVVRQARQEVVAEPCEVVMVDA